MKKRCYHINLILVILLFTLLLTFSACDIESKNKNSRDTIQLWCNLDWIHDEEELFYIIKKSAYVQI